MSEWINCPRCGTLMENLTACPKCEPSNPPTEENVISFYGSSQLEITSKEQKRPYCLKQCKNVQVDDIKRHIVCTDCGRAMEAFDYVMRWAAKGDSRMRALKELDVEITKKNAQLSELKSAVQNVKAQLKRSRGQLDIFTEPTPMQQSS